MSVSTDGIICLGINIPEEQTLPWDVEDYEDRDIEDWWLQVKGYEPPFELYNSEGEYINGVRPSDEKVSEYYRCQREFKEKNPIPIKLVMHCSGDYPMWIIAIKSTYLKASRGYPEEFDPNDLSFEQSELDTLIDFCEEYEIELQDTPKWWLCSLWGY